MPVNRAITCGCLCTLIFEILGLVLWGSLLHFDHRLLAISLISGWIPIVVVAIRAALKRAERVTRLDMILMASGFPIVLGTFIAVARFFL